MKVGKLRMSNIKIAVCIIREAMFQSTINTHTRPASQHGSPLSHRALFEAGLFPIKYPGYSTSSV